MGNLITFKDKHCIMGIYSSYATCKNPLYLKYGKESWFAQVLGFANIRYTPVETRILNVLRYVELSPSNATTFSYELGSILRDIGSVFGSLLATFVKNTEGSDRSDISDYVKFLNNEVLEIKRIGVELFCPFENRTVFPFTRIADERIPSKDRLLWWEPHNNLKHSEINNLKDGSLSNVVYGMASLAILCKLTYPHSFYSRLFPYAIGYFEPMETISSHEFPSDFYVKLDNTNNENL